MVLNFFKELKSQTAKTTARTAAVVGMSLSVLLTTAISLPASAANESSITPKVRPLQKTPVGSAAYVADQIIVMPTKGLDKDDLDQSIKDIDGKIVDKDLMGMAYLVEVPKGTLEKELVKAGKDKHFKAVQRNAIAHANAVPSFGTTPNDPGYPLQFYLAQIGVQGAWALGATGDGVVMGLLDTGMDYTGNQDLIGRNTGLLGGLGYQSYRGIVGGGDEEPSFGHGSFVTNCFGASTNNNFGFAGGCFNSKIVPVSIVGAGSDMLGSTDFSTARGIQFLMLNNVKLANLSFGVDPPGTYSDFFFHPLLTELFNMYAQVGGVIFNAAGNSGIPDGIGQITPGLVVVAAVDPTLIPTSFTVFGPAIQFAAPGQGIAQTGYGGQPFVADGTSFSSPFACSVAGLVKSARPDLPYATIVQIMARSCTHPLQSQGTLQLFFGNGVPNAAAAVRLAQTSF